MSYAKWYKTLQPRKHSALTGLARHGVLLAAAAGLLLVLLAPEPLGADPLLTYPLRIGEHTIRAELANTPETRRKGLMFRNRLAESSGMVFIFPREQRISMWMKNTPIALSVAFIDGDGRIDFALGAGWTKQGTIHWLTRSGASDGGMDALIW